MLWTTDGGIARLLTSLDGSDSRSAFATVPVGKLTTFAHELGHVMGVDHEREEGSINLPFPYSHGYVLRGVRDEERGFDYKTIMTAAGGTLPRFSNPRQRFRGAPLGVPGEEPTLSVDGPADAARSMNETRRVVANYRRSSTRCGYRLSAPSEVPPAGGSHTLRVEADDGCRWTARGADGFTTVTSGASGTGDGTVAYRVPANEGWLREVALAVAGRMHVAVQPGTRPVKPVCERTAGIRGLIEAELGTDCANIAAAELSRVTRLDWTDASDKSAAGRRVQPARGDFDGLSNLGHLRLAIPDGGALPVGVFDGLASVTRLEMSGRDLSLESGSFRGLRNAFQLEMRLEGERPVPSGAFDGMPRLNYMVYIGDRPIAPGAFEGLSNMRDLTLWVGEFARLRAGTFHGLANLRRLRVFAGKNEGTPIKVEPGLFDGLRNLERLTLRDLAEVPEGLFAGLSALRVLRLQYNAFKSLPPGVFEGLSSLYVLFLDNGQPLHVPTPHRHELATLPPGLFSGLSSLQRLHLANVGLRDLPTGAFRDVGSTLLFLYLEDNKLAALDAGSFDSLTELNSLFLARNRLATLPPGVFDGLPALGEIDLRDNRLATLPPGVFDNLRGVHDVYLQDNHLAALPSEAFQNMGSLNGLWLHRNRLTTLPPGLFGFRAKAGIGTSRHKWGGIVTLALDGNPGAPFALAFEPVVASAPWQRPMRVAARLAEGAPIAYEVALDAVGGQLEAESATIAMGAHLSDSLAVRPAGRSPTVVRVAGLPDVPGEAGCTAIVDAGRRCSYLAHTGIVLAAGPPLVLNGVADRREFNEPAEIDLANVFLEFDDSAIPALSVRSSDPAVATAELSGRLLKIAPANPGTATITITATTPNGATATRVFSVTVPVQRAFLHGWRLTLLDDGEGAQENPVRPTHRLRPKEHPSPDESVRGFRHAE